jgi:hypothetical protein
MLTTIQLAQFILASLEKVRTDSVVNTIEDIKNDLRSLIEEE